MKKIHRPHRYSLRNGQLRILRALVKSRPASVQRLSIELERSHESIHRDLRPLRDMGLVRVDVAHQSYIYWPTLAGELIVNEYHRHLGELDRIEEVTYGR